MSKTIDDAEAMILLFEKRIKELGGRPDLQKIMEDGKQILVKMILEARARNRA